MFTLGAPGKDLIVGFPSTPGTRKQATMRTLRRRQTGSGRTATLVTFVSLLPAAHNSRCRASSVRSKSRRCLSSSLSELSLPQQCSLSCLSSARRNPRRQRKWKRATSSSSSWLYRSWRLAQRQPNPLSPTQNPRLNLPFVLPSRLKPSQPKRLPSALAARSARPGIAHLSYLVILSFAMSSPGESFRYTKPVSKRHN